MRSCRFRRFLLRFQTALKNKIHAILDDLLPGISLLEAFKHPHIWDPASLDFFAKYPNVNLVSRLRIDQIVEFFRRRGRQLSPEQGFQINRWTKETFNQLPSAISTRERILRSLLLKLKGLKGDISELEVEILGYLVQIPAVLLLSIDYIGPIRAWEITPFEQYPNSRALIKGAGLDSTTLQSSTYESTKHPTSKKGSKNLRYIGVDISNALMRHNDYFASFANQLMERGKSQDCACIATACRAFWMIKNQRPFSPPNGLGVSKDPLAKIELFLKERHASDKIEEYVNLAKRFFDKSQGLRRCL